MIVISIPKEESMFRSFDEMIDFVKKMEKKQVVAVVGADKPVAVEAAIDMVWRSLSFSETRKR